MNTATTNTRRPTLNRPLVLVAVAFWAGVLLMALGWIVSFFWVAVLGGLSLILWRSVPERFRYAHFPVAMLFVITGAFVWNIHHLGPPVDSMQHIVLAHPEDTQYTLVERVERSDILLEDDTYLQCYLRVQTIMIGDEVFSVSGGVLLRWSQPDAPLYHSELISVKGKLLPAIQRVNHDVRGVENHHRLNGVHSSMRLSGAQAVLRQHQPNTFSLSYYASRLRQDIAGRLVKVIPASAQDFVLTVWLGDRRRVAGETYTTFLESGTAHILAVSGVHIGLIYITISYFLRLIIRSPRKRIIITLIAVVLFAFVAGARVSSLRAAIMIGLYLMSEWVDRERDAPTALSLAALIFGIHNPDVIFMAGFQLSFLSIASILLFRPTIEGVFSGLPPALQEGFSTTLSVQLLPLPAALIAFHVLPVAGVLLNLIIIPILSIVLWLAFMTTFSAYLFPPVAQWFAHALVPFVHLIEWIAETTSRLPMSHVYMSKPSTISIIAYFVALGAMWWWLGDKSRQRKPLITAGCAVLIGFVFWTPWSHTPNMTFLDVGHGDAAVIQTEDRKTILIDGGKASDYVDMGKQVVAPYLWNQHTSRIDAIIVSHADSDHVGGLRYVIEHFPVEIVYTAPEFGDTVEGQEFLDVCARSNTPVQTLVAGDVLQMGTARIQVLHPTLESLAPLSDNDRSLVFTLESDGLSALFTGDIESKAEALIFAEHAARVDIIKVPHHGSNTSSTPILFEGVDSQHAIVSSGLRRNKPLAKLEVLQRYRDDGQTVHRSDYAGSIRVEVHDSDVVITHAREIKGISVRE